MVYAAYSKARLATLAARLMLVTDVMHESAQKPTLGPGRWVAGFKETNMGKHGGFLQI